MGFYGRYSAFGAGSPVVDDGQGGANVLSFAQQHSYDDWLSNSWGTGLNQGLDSHLNAAVTAVTVGYTPIDPSVTAAANTVWQGLATAAQIYDGSSAVPIMSVYRDRLNSAIAAVDGIETAYPQVPYLWVSPADPNDQSGLRQSRINAYNTLNQALKDLSNVDVPDGNAERLANAAYLKAQADKAAAVQATKQAAALQVVAKQQASAQAAVAASQAIASAKAQTAAANADIAAAQQRIAAATSTSADTAAVDWTSNIPIIAALIGVPILGFTAWHFLKKKPAAVGRYRRRSRR